MNPRHLFYWTIKTMAWPVTRAWVRLRVVGTERVPRQGACIVVANHASYVDAVVLGSAFPRRIAFLITAPIYNMRRLKWFYSMMAAIPVDPRTPDPGALKAALRVLRHGGVVGIFPEGQRMQEEGLGSGKGGVALLASRSGAPVIPAAIVGARRVMPVGAMIPRPRAMKIVFGESMQFPARAGSRPTRDQIDSFAGDVMRAVAALMDDGGNVARAAGGARSSP